MTSAGRVGIGTETLASGPVTVSTETLIALKTTAAILQASLKQVVPIDALHGSLLA